METTEQLSDKFEEFFKDFFRELTKPRTPPVVFEFCNRAGELSEKTIEVLAILHPDYLRNDGELNLTKSELIRDILYHEFKSRFS